MNRYVITGVSAALVAAATLAVWSVTASTARAHCQVPCGIYDDPARVQQLHEDQITIAKAIKSVRELAGKNDAQSINQMVRWTTTKEDHASHIINLMANYFLAQRVKPVAPGNEGRDAYLTSLADHHAIIVAAMKCKQQADPAAADALHEVIHAIEKYYPK